MLSLLTRPNTHIIYIFSVRIEIAERKIRFFPLSAIDQVEGINLLRDCAIKLLILINQSIKLLVLI